MGDLKLNIKKKKPVVEVNKDEELALKPAKIEKANTSEVKKTITDIITHNNEEVNKTPTNSYNKVNKPNSNDKTQETKNKKPDMSVEEAKDLLKTRIFECSNAPSSKPILYMSPKFNLTRYITRNDVEALIMNDYPCLVKWTEDKNGLKTHTMEYHSNFLKLLYFENQVEHVVERVDLYQEEELKFEYNKDKNIVSIITNKMIHNNPDKLDISITKDIENLIIKDFREYFEEFDSILEWNVACRFTPIRRTSFLHLRANAGFGKTFLAKCFIDLGLWNKIEASDIKEHASGLNPIHFKHSIGLLMDEFKKFDSTMKEWNTHISVEPKYGQKKSIEVFAKIFLSAEKSESFTNGINEQISDRLCVIDKQNSPKLEFREIHKQYKSIYGDVLIHYIHNTIKEHILRYRSYEKIEARDKATKVLEDFYNKWKIVGDNLDTVIRKHFFDTVYNIYDANEYDLTREEKEIKMNIVLQGDYLFIKKTKKTYDKIMEEGSEGFQKKAKHSESDWQRIILQDYKADYKVVGQHRIGVNGKPISSMKVSIAWVKTMSGANVLADVPIEHEVIKVVNEEEYIESIEKEMTEEDMPF